METGATSILSFSDSNLNNINTVVIIGTNVGLGNAILSALNGGDRNVAMGNGSFAAIISGSENTAVGDSSGATLTTGSDNVLVGSGADVTAIGISGSVAVGRSTTVAATSVAVGNLAQATNTSNIAIGGSASAITGTSIIAIGDNAISIATRAIAIGFNASSSGLESISIGDNTIASSTGGIAIGDGAQATTNIGAMAIGTGTIATGLRSTAVGNSSDALAQEAVAVGDGAQATRAQSIAIGNNPTASQIGSVAIGDQSMAVGGIACIAIGRSAQVTTTSGAGGIALGDGANATATAQGRGIAIGFKAITAGQESVGIGDAAICAGNRAVAVGNAATASSTGGIAIGNAAQTTTGNGNVAIGDGATSTGTAPCVAIGAGVTNSTNASVQLPTNLAATIGTGFASTFSAADGGTLSPSIVTISSDGNISTTGDLNADGVITLGAANLLYPAADGGDGDVLTTDGEGNLLFETPTVGDVVGPVSSIDNAIVVFDETTGKLTSETGATPILSFSDANLNNIIGTTTTAVRGTAANNVGLGNAVLTEITTSGNENVGVGNNALSLLTTGTTNVAVGYNAGNVLTTGDGNVIIGHNADTVALGIDNGVAIGLLTTVSTNAVAVGNSANATSTGGIAIGGGAQVTTGDGNVAIGDGATATGTVPCVAIGAGVTNSTAASIQLPRSLAATTSTGFASTFSAADGGTLAPSIVTISSDGNISTIGNLNADGIINLGAANLLYPAADGADGDVLTTDGAGNLLFETPMVGPVSSTDNAMVVFDKTTGKLTSETGATPILSFSDANLNNIIGTNTVIASVGSANNIGIGDSVFGALTFGDQNIGIGNSSLSATTDGNSNVGIGHNALLLLTTGTTNVVIGNSAGGILTTGGGNVILGSGANATALEIDNGVAIGLLTIVAGNAVAVGNNANAISTGAVAVGNSAQATTGDGNVAIGDGATATGTAPCVAIGAGVINSIATSVQFPLLLAATTGTGFASTFSDADGGTLAPSIVTISSGGNISTTGNLNADGVITLGAANLLYPAADGGDGDVLTTDGIGNLTLQTPTIGDVVGPGSATINAIAVFRAKDGEAISETGAIPILFFSDANLNNIIGTNTVIAPVDSANNIGIGDSVFGALTLGDQNIAIGNSSLNATTEGYSNVGIGHNALLLLTTGTTNVVIGNAAGKILTTGGGNVILGSGANTTTLGINNAVAIGLLTTVAENAVSIGNFANAISTGAVAVGNGAQATTGNGNIAIGDGATATGTAPCVAIGAGVINSTAASVQLPRSLAAITSTGFASTFSAADGGTLAPSIVTISSGGNISTTGNLNADGVITLGNANLTYPAIDGGNGDVLTTDGAGNLTLQTPTVGDVIGPGSATINAIAVFSATDGEAISETGTIPILFFSDTNLNNIIGTNTITAPSGSENNIGIGDSVFGALTSGNQNIGIGNSSLNATTEGGSNVGIGHNALLLLSTGTTNVVIGNSAGGILTTGGGNVILGSGANATASRVDNAVAIGLLTTVANNAVAVGNAATASSTRGIAIGNSAQATTGNGNIAIGDGATAIGTAPCVSIGTGVTNSTAASIKFPLSLAATTGGFISTFSANDGGILAPSTVTISSGGNVRIIGNLNAYGVITLGAANLTYPNVDGRNGDVLTTDGGGNLLFQTPIVGDILGPRSATINAITVFSALDGKAISETGTTPILFFSDANLNNIIGTNTITAPAGSANNIGIGDSIFRALTLGNQNIAIGNSSLNATTEGGSNVGIGHNALLLLSTGTTNIVIGNSAGGILTTGGGNVILGSEANATASGVDNGVAIGLLTTVANNAVAVGNSANAISTGGIAIGDNAQAATGDGNVAIGDGATATGTAPCVAIGAEVTNSTAASVQLPRSLVATTGTGFASTFSAADGGTLAPSIVTISSGGNISTIGNGSFAQLTVDNLVSTSSDDLSLVAADGLSDMIMNALAVKPTVNGTVELGTDILGWEAMTLGTPSTDFTVTFKAPTLTSSYSMIFPPDDGVYGQVLSTNGSGVLSWVDNVIIVVPDNGEVSSDAITDLDTEDEISTTSTFQDITDLQDEIDSTNIYKLRPVTFHKKENPNAPWKHVGLIAEECAEVFPHIVVWRHDINLETQQKKEEITPTGIRYSELTVLLLAEMQKQQKMIETLTKRIGELET